MSRHPEWKCAWSAACPPQSPLFALPAHSGACSCRHWVSRSGKQIPNGMFRSLRDRLALADPDLRDTQLVARQHFDAHAVAVHKLPRARDMSEPLAHQTANRGRFDIFFAMESLHQVADPGQIE